jgi:hypothetical protein
LQQPWSFSWGIGIPHPRDVARVLDELLGFAIDGSQVLLRPIRADRGLGGLRILSQHLRISGAFGAALADQFGYLPKVGRFNTLACVDASRKTLGSL